MTFLISFFLPRIGGNIINVLLCLVKLKRLPKKNELAPWIFKVEKQMIAPLMLRALCLGFSTIIFFPIYAFSTHLNTYVSLFSLLVTELSLVPSILPPRRAPLDKIVKNAVENGDIDEGVIDKMTENRELVLALGKSLNMKVRFFPSPYSIAYFNPRKRNTINMLRVHYCSKRETSNDLYFTSMDTRSRESKSYFLSLFYLSTIFLCT